MAYVNCSNVLWRQLGGVFPHMTTSPSRALVTPLWVVATYFLEYTHHALLRLNHLSWGLHRLFPNAGSVTSCGNHSTNHSIQFLLLAMMMTSVAKMSSSQWPSNDIPIPWGITIKYFLHRHGSDESSFCGAAVVSVDSMYPPFDASANQNMFQHLFGIEFHFGDHTHVCGISPFEFASYCLSRPSCKFALDSAVPNHTLAWIFEQIHTYLVFVHDLNCKISPPNKWAAPAASIQSFVNGAIGTQLPSHSCWVAAYANNPACCMIQDLALNPGKILKATLLEVHYAYHQPLCQSHIVIEDKIFILRELIHGSTSCARLQIVPAELQNILFDAFHSNPIDRHLNAYRTLHWLRMWFHWLEMYSYIKRMCQACPGCALSNPLRGSSLELIHHFPLCWRLFSWKTFWVQRQRGLLDCLRHARLLSYGNHPACEFGNLCVWHYESPTPVWILPHDQSRKG